MNHSKLFILLPVLLAFAGEGLSAESAPALDAGSGQDADAAAAQPGNETSGLESHIGYVTGCRKRSLFMLNLRIPEDAKVSTSTPGLIGFNILMRDPKSNRIRPLVHDSWKSAGNLGQFTYDRDGNIYLVPVPLTSLEVNPPQEQNKVYIIDAKTGRMREFIDLPAPGPIDTSNPFGTIGLAYDCETHSLYVSSLAGSGPAGELGTVFRIDLEDNRVKSRLEGIDVLGIGVFKGVGGKRLYIGSARRAEVLSVALDAHGDFSGEPRFEFDLGEQGMPGNYRAQKIRFTPHREMRLKTLPFAYSLRLIEARDIHTATLRYLPGDRWQGE